MKQRFCQRALLRLLNGDFEDGWQDYERVLQINPGNEAILWSRSLLRLSQGDFARGWQEYEYRWTQPGFVPRYPDRPRWDGSSLKGKTIFLHAEQGLGDTIQFIRYLPMVKQRGGTVLFGCQPALVRLARTLPEWIGWWTRGRSRCLHLMCIRPYLACRAFSARPWQIFQPLSPICGRTAAWWNTGAKN